MILDLLAALDSAVEEFRRRLAQVSDDDWTLTTPCTDWDVHYLVAHVVGGNRFASMVLDAQTAADAIAAVMGAEQLGANALGDFDESNAAQRAAFRRDGALEKIVSHPLGDLSGKRFLEMRVFDIALHAWDLAVAIGDDTTLDPRLVDAVLEVVRHEALGIGFGIEPCGVTGPEASAMEQLLDLSGRCTRTART
jgi:uncharacterized protein (TIGR03086 family)